MISYRIKPPKINPNLIDTGKINKSKSMNSSLAAEIEKLSFQNSNSNSKSVEGEKAVIVRVKRKLNQSPLEALWIEINERPKKRPLLDFQNLSIHSSSTSINEEVELKVKRVLVQHVETVGSSEDTVHFLNAYVEAGSEVKGDSMLTASSSKQQRRTVPTNKIHDRLLSKAKQQQQEQAQSARFEQIWKHRAQSNESIHNEALGEVCRVYDVVRVDMETSNIQEKQEEISVEDQEKVSKFFSLLKECVPDAAEEIESGFSGKSKQASVDGYVYDLYAVTQKTDEVEPSYPFPLVQLDDDDHCYDGPDDSDYETDDSNAENHAWNDYPEEESSEDETSEEDKSEKSRSESEETETDRDTLSVSDDDAVFRDRSDDPWFDEDMDNPFSNGMNSDNEYGGNSEDW